MFDTNSDDNSSLNDLFDSDDPDSLEESTSDNSTAHTGSNSDDALSDHTDLPSREQHSSSPSEQLTTPTDESPSDTTDQSLVVRATSLLPAVVSTRTNSTRWQAWLSQLLSWVRFGVRKLFFIIMAPVIFLLVFFGTFIAYFIPGIIALYAFFLIPYIWMRNPFQFTPTGQLIASGVLAVVFFVAVYTGIRLGEYYE